MKYPIRLYISILLLLIIAVVSCKKDQLSEEAKPEFKVSNYYPNSGLAGTLVTIEGQGFSKDLTHYSAFFSGTSAEVISATSSFIVLRAPVGAASGNVELKYQGQTYQVGAYTYQDLSLQKIFPVNGPAGTNIRISGTGFGSADKPAIVTINGTEAIIVSLTDTLIIATVPDGATSGAVVVKVDDKSSAGPIFKVQTIHEMSPKTGGKGTRVILKGSGFETELAKNYVTFNGKAARVLEATEEQLVVLAPDGVETGAVFVRINDIITEGPVFTVVPAPIVNIVNPLSGLAGTEMTITGKEFSEITGETKVFINNIEVVVTSVSKTTIKLTIPANISSGKVNVAVNGQIAEGPVFTNQALGILRTTPESGAAGMEVTIFGSGFSEKPADNAVTFNNIPAQVTSASATQLKVIVPVGAATGSIKIRVAGKEAISSAPFAIQSVITLTSGLSASISSITVGLNGDIYATDPEKNQVMKISKSGTVTLFAGSTVGQGGVADGLGTSATFNRPIGITADAQGNLYVVEKNTTNIRKITPGGQVSTFSRSFWIIEQPASITADLTNGMLYVTGVGSDYSIVRFKLDAEGRPDYTFGSPVISPPKQHIGIDASGAIYYIGYQYPSSYAISTSKNPGIKIGSEYEPGFSDGDYSSARFEEIQSIVVNSKNQLLVADFGNNALRLVDLDNQVVSTLFKAEKGYQDGTFSSVKFGELTDIVISDDGIVYILDKVNKAIRKVSY